MKYGKRKDGTNYKTIECGEIRKDGKKCKPRLTPTAFREIKREVIHKIRMRKTKADIIDWLMEVYEYSQDRAERIYTDSKAEIDVAYEKYKEDVAKANIERLNAIIDDCDERGDRRSMLSAIDMLNKMANVYTTKIDVKTNEPIKLSLSN